MSDNEPQPQSSATNDNVVIPPTTEHQVGVDENGQPIMGRDRAGDGGGGELDFAAFADVGEQPAQEEGEAAGAEPSPITAQETGTGETAPEAADEAAPTPAPAAQEPHREGDAAEATGEQQPGGEDNNNNNNDNNVGAESAPAPAEAATVERFEEAERQPPQNNDGAQQPAAAAAAAASNNNNTTRADAATTSSSAPTAPAAAALPLAEPTLPVRVVARPGGFATVVDVPLNAQTSAIVNRVAQAWQVDRNQFRLLSEGSNALDGFELLKSVFVFAPRFTADSVSQGQLTEYHEVFCEAEFDLLPDHLRVLAPGDDVVKVITVVVRSSDEGGALAAAMSASSSQQHDQQQSGSDLTFKLATVRALERKPFLGGYRNTKTQVCYYDAAGQTVSPSEIRRNTIQRQSRKEMITRMTQTQGKTRSCQTTCECGTQMPRGDLQVTEEYDRVVTALPYFSAEQLLSVHVQKAIRIQSLARGWRARKMARELREAREAEEAELAAEDERRRTLHARRRQEEVNRRVHPRTTKDFAILYNELEAWRLQEGQRIREAKNVPEVEKALALQELLKKETKLLQTIDRLQLQANQENRTKRVGTTLDKMSAPKKWGTKGLEVETPFTTRAKELRDLYNGLLLKGLSIDERLDVLLHVKWTVKEFNCALTRDIVELVDREADLLNRGRKDGSLDSLRVRTANLFLQFCETPEFNPEAINFQKAPLEFASRPHVALTKR